MDFVSSEPRLPRVRPAGPGEGGNRRHPGLLPEPRRHRLGKETRDPHTPHCVDNRNHKIAITVSEAVNKRDTPGF